MAVLFSLSFIGAVIGYSLLITRTTTTLPVIPSSNTIERDIFGSDSTNLEPRPTFNSDTRNIYTNTPEPGPTFNSDTGRRQRRSYTTYDDSFIAKPSKPAPDNQPSSLSISPPKKAKVPKKKQAPDKSDKHWQEFTKRYQD